MKHSPGGLLRALARLLVRGPHAPFILGDMEEAMQRDVARGMSRRRARARFLANALGSALSVARSGSALRGPPRLAGVLLDAKLGWRMLWKSPVLTAVAGLALAVGIPVGLAPVHVRNAFEAPPPVEAADRLMGLRYYGIGPNEAATTSYELGRWRQTLTSFDDLGAVRQVARNLAPVSGVPMPVAAAEVTASTFSILRVRPLLGRTFQPADETPGAAPVVVVSYEIWQSRLAGSGDVVGSTVRIGDVPHTVIGVMPEGFLFPVHEQLWLPLRERPAAEPGQGAVLSVFGRLTDRASEETAQAELAAVQAGVSRQFPERFSRVRAEVVPLTTLLSGFPKGGMGALPGIGPLSFISVFRALALALLLVACANVGLLIFARTATRAQELVVRTALGASRTRIVGQVVIEALVLALVAAGAGLVLLDLVADRLLLAMWPSSSGGLPWWIDLGVNATTVARALVLAVFSAMVAALVPALRVTGEKIRGNMRAAEAGGFGIRFGGVWSALIIADVAAAVGAVALTVGLSARLDRAASGRVMAGLAAEEYLAVRLELPELMTAAEGSAGSEQRARLARTQRLLVEGLEAEPGVRGVAVADRLPRMDHDSRRMQIENGPGAVVEVVRVDPGFFRALGQSVVSGRDFERRDLEGTRTAVIVNSSFATELLGGRDPVGRRIRYQSGREYEPGPWLEIVGMVGDLGSDLLHPEEAAAVYHAAAPGEVYPIHIAVRAGPDPASFTPRFRTLAGAVAPAFMVTLAMPLSDVVPTDWYLMAGVAAGWMLFVGVLLALAASGVYAIMAFAVAQRTREIGIRVALGARGIDIAATIGRRAAVQLGMGAAAGMPVAAWVHFQLLGAEPTATLEAFLVCVVPGVLVVLVVGLAACTGPLARALRIAPNHAIKETG